MTTTIKTSNITDGSVTAAKLSTTAITDKLGFTPLANNAASLTANKLTTPRTISIGGDASGSVSFDGSEDVVLNIAVGSTSVVLGTDTIGDYLASISSPLGTLSVMGSGESATVTVDLPNTGVNAGTYGSSTQLASVTVDAQGRITSASQNSLSTSNVTEDTNLYYTDTRSRAAISVAGGGVSLGGEYSAATGDLVNSSSFQFVPMSDPPMLTGGFAGEWGGRLAANLDALVGKTITFTGYTGFSGTNNPVTVTTTIIGYGTDPGDNLQLGPEAINATEFIRRVDSFTITDTGGGSAGPLTYDSATGEFTFTTPDTDSIEEGTTNLYYTDARVGTYLTTNSYATEDYVDTAIGGVDLTGYATETYVNTAVSNLVDSAPSTLDTLNELATALGNDENFSTTVTNLIGDKLDSADYTAEDIISKLVNVDGASSGLDADLWDGYQFDDYLNQSVKTGSTPIFNSLRIGSDNPVITGIQISGSGSNANIISDAGATSSMVSGTLKLRTHSNFPNTTIELNSSSINSTVEIRAQNPGVFPDPVNYPYPALYLNYFASSGSINDIYATIGSFKSRLSANFINEDALVESYVLGYGGTSVPFKFKTPAASEKNTMQGSDIKNIYPSSITNVSKISLYGTYVDPTTTSISNAAAGDIILGDTASSPSLFWYDGTNWNKLGGGSSLSSTDDLLQGSTNLYYTDTRVADYLFNNAYATESYVATYLLNNAYATESYVTTQISNLIDAAPAALDTLNELAAALGDDENFATTITNALSNKQDTLFSSSNIKTINGISILGAGDIVIGGSGGTISYNDLSDKPTIPTDLNDLTDADALLSQGGITSTFPGDLTTPYTGTVRRYILNNITLKKMGAFVSTPASSNITITLLKNGTTQKSVTIPTGDSYVAFDTADIPCVVGDYLTIDVSGGSPNNLVVSLNY